MEQEYELDLYNEESGVVGVENEIRGRGERGQNTGIRYVEGR